MKKLVISVIYLKYNFNTYIKYTPKCPYNTFRGMINSMIILTNGTY
jgi:hypothetical protein